MWAARTPDDVVVPVEASRFLSHTERLREPEEPVARLMDRVAALGEPGRLPAAAAAAGPQVREVLHAHGAALV